MELLIPGLVVVGVVGGILLLLVLIRLVRNSKEVKVIERYQRTVDQWREETSEPRPAFHELTIEEEE